MNSVPRPTTIQTARGPVEFARGGTGRPLLLLHGALGGYDQSWLLGRALTGGDGFDHIAISRPGYLGTPLASGAAPAAQADLCAALLDSLGVATAAVAAVSGGGQCALEFAVRHPGRCRGLVLVAACSGSLTGRVPLRFQLIRLAGRIPALAAALRRRTAADPRSVAARSIPDASLCDRTLAHPEAGPLLLALQASVMERLPERLPGTHNDIRQSRVNGGYANAGIPTPALIVHGTEDKGAPYALAAALATGMPRAELLTIPGGGHASLFTHLEVVRQRAQPFLLRC